MKKVIVTLICTVCICGLSYSQSITQTVKGTVKDLTTGEPTIGANMVLIDSEPLIGTIVDFEGNFIMEDVPVGRQSFKVSMLGYETLLINDILVSSGKQVVLNIELQEQVTNLAEVMLVPKRQRDKPINKLASVSSRQFTVEETNRYAGGLDDPARLASSFAGVASPSTKSNGISIRGNSPAGLLWRIEGVEIPSPNHFADLNIVGTGALTALSSHVMSNSDFYTGAFPAEYGNATSGVFDINMRSGNTTEREHTFQAGILGLDFASEGPFKKGNNATYLFNYRYATLALIGSLLPDDAGILKYQDLSYKIKIPTEKSGTFSLWGIGAYDSVDTEALDIEEWESQEDRERSQLSQYLFASGLNHKIAVGSKSFLNSTLAFSGRGLSFNEQYLDDNLSESEVSNARKDSYRLTLQSSLRTYFSDKHYNQTGVYINRLGYNLNINDTQTANSTLENIIDEKGQSLHFQLYSQSRFKISPKFTLNTGFNAQYFQLNKEVTFEPRVAISYKLNKKNDLALAYGLHSRMESLETYFIQDEFGKQPNKDLKLMKSNHFVLSYNSTPFKNIRLAIEPYYQSLNNIPVSPDSYVSTLNVEDNLFFNEVLISKGTGRNVGIDFTLEHYLSKGLYYLFTASVFDSKYTANDGIERNTRYNKNYVMNALIGKEWQVGEHKNNTLNANVRFNYLGGNRVEAIDLPSSINNQDVVYGETNGAISFSKRHRNTPITSFSLSYRKNKPKHASIWSLQVFNSGLAEEFDKDIFNTSKQAVEQEYSAIMIPSLSYKIEF
ncbi:TonB-dependent receptor [Aestuariivivens sediminis]|uniref:TonB-dependent receptor n=1 Tax=Aestuariivivens sediminis TaxID=2913557 RepID=UPI001F57CF29|nr:TonB-dependent receptor [Aestuariivivens sediminis]